MPWWTAPAAPYLPPGVTENDFADPYDPLANPDIACLRDALRDAMREHHIRPEWHWDELWQELLDEYDLRPEADPDTLARDVLDAHIDRMRWEWQRDWERRKAREEAETCKADRLAGLK